MRRYSTAVLAPIEIMSERLLFRPFTELIVHPEALMGNSLLLQLMSHNSISAVDTLGIIGSCGTCGARSGFDSMTATTT